MTTNASKMPLWTVKSIRQDTQFTPQGPIPSMKVTISVLGNIDAVVEIPQSEFHQDKVNELAHDLAQKIVTVMGLEGPDINTQVDPLSYLDPNIS